MNATKSVVILEVSGMKMTAKQQAWIDYYKQGHTATEAARLAGYKAKSDKAFQNIGSENLGNLGITSKTGMPC